MKTTNKTFGAFFLVTTTYLPKDNADNIRDY